MQSSDRLSFYLGCTVTAAGGSLNVSTPFADTTGLNFVVVTVSTLSTAPAADLYLNGTWAAGDTGTVAGTPRTYWDTNLRMARPGAAIRYFNGLLDEVRVSNVARAAGWITTEFNNQNDPGVGGFLVGIGGQQASSAAGASWAADQDTPLTNLAKMTTKRVRIEISNESGGSSGAIPYLLEYATSPGGPWTAVPDTATTQHWETAPSSFITTDGEATANISPGLTDENTVSGKVREGKNGQMVTHSGSCPAGSPGVAHARRVRE